MTLLSAQGLTVRAGGRTLLEGVDVSLARGELLGIVGTNGAGKTTLLRVLAGLLVPDAGSVALDGAPLGALPARVRARRLAYLPQGHALHWPLPGREVVALGRLPHGDAHQPNGQAAVRRALAATGTEAFAGRPALALSGGERARLMLARVLAGEPDILLADEPLAALDPAQQLRMLALLRNQARDGRAVAVVLHDLALAARHCSRVAVLCEGRLLACGAPDEVLREPLLAQAFGVTALRVAHAGETCWIPWSPCDAAVAAL